MIKMNHNEKVDNAESAIRIVFGDTSVPPERTIESLEKLKDNIEISLETLRDDLNTI